MRNMVSMNTVHIAVNLIKLSITKLTLHPLIDMALAKHGRGDQDSNEGKRNCTLKW